MEEEILINEEVEPPSRVQAHSASENGAASVFSTQTPPAGFRRFPLLVSTPHRGTPRFKTSARSRVFRKRFFPEATSADWNDWHWQLRYRIKTFDALARILRLSADELQAASGGMRGALPLSIPPPFCQPAGCRRRSSTAAAHGGAGKQ